MSAPHDPHDPRFELDRQDNLTLAALGEPVDPDFRVHQLGCARCQQELAEFTRMVQLARESGGQREQLDAEPAPSVWTGIARELGVDAPEAPPPARRERVRWRTVLVAAAAVVIAVAGAGIGYLAGHDTATSTVTVASTARLTPMPGTPASVAGAATIRSGRHGDQLSVTTHQLPLRAGYYEVWLFDPTINQMVAVGTLADNGTGTFPVPPGLDPHAYHVVDVSAQDYDGSPAHKRSVLRGQLTQ